MTDEDTKTIAKIIGNILSVSVSNEQVNTILAALKIYMGGKFPKSTKFGVSSINMTSYVDRGSEINATFVGENEDLLNLYAYLINIKHT